VKGLAPTQTNQSADGKDIIKLRALYHVHMFAFVLNNNCRIPFVELNRGEDRQNYYCIAQVYVSAGNDIKIRYKRAI
jgi:hypothetical protein